MAKQQPGQVRLPTGLLEDVCWSFTGERFTDRAAFDDAVRQYQTDITNKDTWRPDEVVLPCPRVRIRYECFDEDENEIEPVVELVSDNGVSFSAGELFFKIHNAVVEQLRDLDHSFFEGLSRVRQRSAEVPLYEVSLGS